VLDETDIGIDGTYVGNGRFAGRWPPAHRKFLVGLAKPCILPSTCTLETIMKIPTLLAAVTVSLLTALPAMAACSDPAGPGVDYSECNLTGANLRRADLTGADLTGADLSFADLTRATLTGATLTGANLRHAEMLDGILTGADLSGADFEQLMVEACRAAGRELEQCNLAGRGSLRHGSD
jgi:hypothetical protein